MVLKHFRTKVRKAENILDLCKLYDAEKRRVERTGYYSNNKRLVITLEGKVMKNFKEYAFGASMGQYQPVANLGDFAGKSYYGVPCQCREKNHTVRP